MNKIPILDFMKIWESFKGKELNGDQFIIAFGRAIESHVINSLAEQPVAQPAGVVDGWQPIETAPKDGTPILARAHFYNAPFVIFWGSKAEEFGPMPALPEGSIIERSWILANCDEETCTDLAYSPFEWMPLPSAQQGK